MGEVLVTGADGFVGKHLCDRLDREGRGYAKLTRRDGDIAAPETWARAADCEVVVHLAGRSFVPDSWRQPADFIQTNVTGTVRALEFCRQRGARLVLASSYLYGNPRSLPIAENAPLQALNPYALSKQMAEEACRFFAERVAVPVTVLRPFNIYGPGQPEYFLIPAAIAKVRQGGAVQMQDLEPRRDYIHVADVVDALVRASSPSTGFRVFNIGSGVSHSVADVVAMLQDIAGTSLPVTSSGGRREHEVLDTVADVRVAREQLGWSAGVSLREGLEDIWRREERCE